MARTAATGRTAATNRVAVQDMKSSLSFNGTSSYITPAIAPNITGFNFGMWVKINATATWQELVSCAGSAENKGFLLKRQPNGGIYVLIPHSGGGIRYIDFASGASGKEGKWMHLVFTHVQGSQKAYVNGTLVDSDTATMIDQAGQAMYFGRSWQLANFYSGLMSGVVFHNTTTPWTQAQITALYQNGTIPSGATCVLPLNEGAGTTAYDSSGNGNNGTITAGSWTRDTPTKKRKVVNGNMVYNGDFEIAPVVNVPTTTVARWIDGTAAGSTTNNIFGWGVVTKTGTAEAIFDSTSPSSGTESMKVSTTATASKIQVGSNGIDTAGNNRLSCISVLPSTSYTLTFRMKTQLNSGTATGGAKVAVNTFTGAGAYVGTPVLTTAIKTTTDWTTYTSTFTTSETVRLLAAYLVVDGSGGAATLIMDAWFDDIVLTPTTPTTRSAA